jgi:hypothetical protein
MNTQISNELSTTNTAARRAGRNKLFICVAALTAIFGALTAGAPTAHANGPTGVTGAIGDSADAGSDGGDLYANVQSPFGSESHMLRDDDLVLTLGNESSQVAGMQNSWISPISTSNAVGTQCAYGASCPQTFLEYDFEQPPVIGRFFNTPEDTIVQTPANFGDPNSFNILSLNGSAGTYQFGFTQGLPYGTNATTTSISAVADFDGDGYEDLLQIYSDYANQFAGNGRGRILTAHDVNQPNAGFTVGPESSLGFPYGARSVAVGDFNGDGKPEVAVLFIDNNNDPNISIYTVDPRSLNIQLAQNVTYGDPIQYADVYAPMQLVAGTFIPGIGQQLVMATQELSSGSTMKLRVFTFPHPDTPLLPFEAGSIVTEHVSKMKLAAGRFDWSSPVDSLAVMLTNVDNGNSTSVIDIVNVDPSTMTPTIAGGVNVPKDLFDTTNANYVALDIAVGNFDNTKFVPPPQTDGGIMDGGITSQQRDPNLQLAIATGYCQGTNVQQSQFQVKDLFIYDVDPATTGPSVMAKRSSLAIKTSDGSSGKVTRMALSAADLHGRSTRLGPGWRVAQDKTSPAMILAQPPSHIDYVMRSDGTAALENLTFSPNGFNAGYSTSTSTSTSYNQSYSHGWSMAAEENFSGSFRLGTKENNFTFSDSDTAMQDWDKRTDNTYGSISTKTQSLSLQTTTNDDIIYEDVISYLYAFEVVGQTVCPEGQTTCDDSAKVPLTMLFSATGSTTPPRPTAVDTLAWYQPVWENGNILSYPGNQQQLMNGESNLTAVNVSDSPTTSPSSTVISTTWDGQQSESNSVDWAKEFTESSSLSVGGTYTEADFQGKASLNLDLSRSDSTDDLKTQTASISAATTIGLHASAGFKNAYSYTPVIFGQNAPPNYFDPNDPDHAWATPIQSNGITVFGPMRTAFTVDPLSGADSAFWRHTYGPVTADGGTGAFDIALNHPVRWRNVNVSTTETVPDNCVPSGPGYMDCVSEKPRTPGDPMGDAFHRMRGFFIFRTVDANTTTPANQGLQLDSAITGDSLTLEARVYNYSLNPMPPGTKVRVRFYGMPWNPNSDFPVDHTGDVTGGASFEIGEWDTSAIQPFNTDTSIPNFVIASVPFDTSSYTGTFAFWVIAWAEDSSGNLMEELPGKGLTGNPTSTLDGGATRATFSDFTDLEPTVPNSWMQPGDPDTTSFSNNIGFFPGVLTIIPPSLGATLGQHPTGDVRKFSISKVEIPRTRVHSGEAAEVRATVHDGGDAMQRATVYFYDGDPAKGGTIFGARRLPYVDSSADPMVRVQYIPPTCGTHEVYVQVTHAGQAAPTAKAAESIQVACDSSCPEGGDGGTGGGGNSTDDDGGCSVTPGHPGAGLSLLFPLGAVMASFWARRKRK